MTTIKLFEDWVGLDGNHRKRDMNEQSFFNELISLNYILEDDNISVDIYGADYDMTTSNIYYDGSEFEENISFDYERIIISLDLEAHEVDTDIIEEYYNRVCDISTKHGLSSVFVVNNPEVAIQIFIKEPSDYMISLMKKFKYKFIYL